MKQKKVIVSVILILLTIGLLVIYHPVIPLFNIIAAIYISALLLLIVSSLREKKAEGKGATSNAAVVFVWILPFILIVAFFAWLISAYGLSFNAN